MQKQRQDKGKALILTWGSGEGVEEVCFHRDLNTISSAVCFNAWIQICTSASLFNVNTCTKKEAVLVCRLEEVD